MHTYTNVTNYIPIPINERLETTRDILLPLYSYMRCAIAISKYIQTEDRNICIVYDYDL